MDPTELLPFLIPLIIVQAVLLIVTIRHILTHKTYRRGSRGLWLAVVIIGMQFWGPILYFLLGREED
jgi:beta-lactamase regulating signal transducer with metallopeptidase domain